MHNARVHHIFCCCWPPKYAADGARVRPSLIAICILPECNLSELTPIGWCLRSHPMNHCTIRTKGTPRIHKGLQIPHTSLPPTTNSELKPVDVPSSSLAKKPICNSNPRVAMDEIKLKAMQPMTVGDRVALTWTIPYICMPSSIESLKSVFFCCVALLFDPLSTHSSRFR